MQAKFKIKKGDLVRVMVGREKGKEGTVKQVLLKEAKVLIEGVNQVVRFIRPSQACPEGRFTKELPLAISNVAVVDPSSEKISRIGYRVNESGEKERFFKKSGKTVERNCNPK